VRLLSSELRRLVARRACVLLLALGLALGAFIVGVELWNHRPVSAAELAVAEQQAAEDAQQPGVQRGYERCLEQDGGQPRHGGTCEDFLPQPEWYLNRGELRPMETIQDLTVPIAGVLAFMALLAGTSYVGAEFSSGSMTNVLLFEPRRWRVWAAKAGTVVLVVGGYAAALAAAALGAIALAGVAWTDATFTSEQWWHLAFRGARMTAFVAGAAVVGAALTMALRSTVATVGLVVGYLVVGEWIARLAAPATTIPWLASHHSWAFLDGRFRFQQFTDEGRVEVYKFFLRESAVYLGLVAAAILAISLVAFQRRDVD